MTSSRLSHMVKETEACSRFLKGQKVILIRDQNPIPSHASRAILGG